VSLAYICLKYSTSSLIIFPSYRHNIDMRNELEPSTNVFTTARGLVSNQPISTLNFERSFLPTFENRYTIGIRCFTTEAIGNSVFSSVYSTKSYFDDNGGLFEHKTCFDQHSAENQVHVLLVDSFAASPSRPDLTRGSGTRIRRR